jgi:hypothetical protein
MEVYLISHEFFLWVDLMGELERIIAISHLPGEIAACVGLVERVASCPSDKERGKVSS